MAKKSKNKKKPKTSAFDTITRWFSSNRQLSFILVFAAAGTILLLRSFAAPNNGNLKSTPVPALSQTTSYVSLNPNGPPSCDTEDDIHDYTYYGYLNGSFSTTQRLCGLSDFYNGVYWDAGGEGLESEVYVVGSLTDMTITSPAGIVHHAVLIGTSTSKGVITSHYQSCFVPPYSISNNTGGYALPGGTWTYTLSGNFSKATYYTRTDMTSVTFQRTYCPASEQNLAP